MDPFGLSELRYRAGTTDRLLVYRGGTPQWPPEVRGLDPAACRPADLRRTPGRRTFTLREYQVGDDLRQVHWPSSASATHWSSSSSRCRGRPRLVLLDVRAERYRSTRPSGHGVRRRRDPHLHEAASPPSCGSPPA
jgi:hypothetical protein